MQNLITCRTATIVAGILLFSNALAQVPVIPGGVGFGMNTPAGRGGAIIRVTNLNDSGPGSLRACVQASGPRYCIFEISGSIVLNSILEISNSNVTIAGQTAPAPGILIRGASFIISASDVLVQHLESRAGNTPNSSQVNEPLIINGRSGSSRNVVMDHCSFSWTTDENVSTYRIWDNVTISNSIISESLANTENGYAALIENDTSYSKIAFIGNLFAHNHARNPRVEAPGFIFVNNVIYDPETYVMFLYNRDGFVSNSSVVGNVVISGPNTTAPPFVTIDGSANNAMLPGSKLYLADNMASGVVADQWSMVRNQASVTRSQLEATSAPIWLAGLNPMKTSGGTVYDYVLTHAGSRPGERGTVDTRIISDVRNRTGGVIHCVVDNGTSLCAKNAGGWPNLAVNRRTLTVPNNPHGDDDNDGYTNVEEWLQAMAAAVEGGSSPPPGNPPRPNPPQILN